jgi:N-acylneuraminate cytidylyltransferase
MSESSVAAVVIGRAESRGLPGKNTLVVAGRPMVAHSVLDACRAATVDRVYCSTDGEAIAAAAKDAGATVIFRPTALSGADATVDSAVRHAIDSTNDPAEIIVVLYANVPVRPTDLIDRAVETLCATGADSVQSYAAVGKFHPYWTVTIDGGANVAPWEANTVYRRQDLPEAFIPDGGVIAVRRACLFDVDPAQPHAFLGRDRRGIHTKRGDVVDVDDAIDHRVAEAILEARLSVEAST